MSSELKCPYCPETRPSRSRLATHIQSAHADANSFRAAAAAEKLATDDVSRRMEQAGKELALLKAKADDVAARLEALDAGVLRTEQSLDAERKFQSLVREQGGTVLEVGWKGSTTPHAVVCASGHVGTIKPKSVIHGSGICGRCGAVKRTASRSAAAEAKFRDLVATRGGVVLDLSWKGVLIPHLVRCAAGHEESVKPKRVLQGRGLCSSCTWSNLDVVYVVFNDELGQVKLGVTSGDPKVRLSAHATDGFRNVLAVYAGLPEGIAPQVELSLLHLLRDADARPVRGREYFDGAWTQLILDETRKLIGDWS